MIKLFQWRDWPYYLFSTLYTVLLIIAAFTPQTRVVEWWEWLSMAGIGCLFWASILWLAYYRHRWNKRIVYMLPSNVAIVFDGVAPVTVTEVSAQLERTRRKWEKLFPKSEVFEATSNLVIIFKPHPFKTHSRPGLLAGLALPTKGSILVGLPELGVSRSAMDHELGHLILWRSGLDASERSLADYEDRLRSA